MTTPALAFTLLIECLLKRDWTTAKSLVPAAVDEEMTMCRPPCRQRAPSAEVNQLNHELEKQLNAAQALLLSYRWPADVVRNVLAAAVAWQAEVSRGLAPESRDCLTPESRELLDAIQAAREAEQFLSADWSAAAAKALGAADEPRRPSQLVERLVEAAGLWRSELTGDDAARVRVAKRDDGRLTPGEIALVTAHEALEDADIFSGGPPEPEPLLYEEVEDDIPPPSEPVLFPGRSAEQLHVLATALREQHAADGHNPKDPRWPAADELDKLAKYRARAEQGATVVLTEAKDGPDIDRLKAAGWELRDNGYWAAPGDKAGSWSTADALRELDSGTVNQCHICHGPNDRVRSLSTRCSACHSRAVHNRAVLDGIRRDTEFIRGPRSSSR